MKKPVLIICGLLGTGKTTVSKHLETNLKDYRRFNTDDTRKKLGIQVFDRKDTPMVNDHMYETARNLLEENQGVMFDSAYKTKIARQKIYEFALYYKVPVLVLECVCSPETSKSRISKRVKDDNLHSPTNDPDVYDQYIKLFQPITSDLEDEKNNFVSFAKWDTDTKTLEKLKVNQDCNELLEEIKTILSSFVP